MPIPATMGTEMQQQFQGAVGIYVAIPAFPQHSSSCSGALNLQPFFASSRLGVRFCISVRRGSGAHSHVIGFSGEFWSSESGGGELERTGRTAALWRKPRKLRVQYLKAPERRPP